tara:strand:- start:622 stop:1293 length:672 start_codon:yes stop_codon:yes gene_type:complete
MVKISRKKPFFNPTKFADESADSPGDKINNQVKNNLDSEKLILDLTLGKINIDLTKHIPANLNVFYEDFYINKKKKINQYNIMSKTNGRTLNIPKSLPAGILPGPSYNGAQTIGEKCVGPHCSIPVTPTSGFYNYYNLRSANPPEGALYHSPSTYRLGNSSDTNPSLTQFSNGSGTNYGPFNITAIEKIYSYDYILNPETGKQVSTKSLEGKQVMESYFNYNK